MTIEQKLQSVQKLLSDRSDLKDQVKGVKSVREFIDICHKNGIQITQAEQVR